MSDAKPAEKATEKKESTRRKYRDDTWTDEQVEARRKKLSAEEVPAGFIKLTEVVNACRVEGIPVSKLVRVTGGDRCMNEPLDPVFQVTYVGRTRYMKPQALEKGMKLLADPNFAVTKRKPRKKAEPKAKTDVKVTKVTVKEA